MSDYNNPLIEQTKKTLPACVGIIGAGTIGPDIGYYLKSAIPGLKLVLVDVVQTQLDQALKRIEGYADKGIKRGKLSKERAEEVKTNILGTLDYGQLADCDWVIEAATEDLELKRKIFAQIEAVVRRDALITSNTSSLPAAWLFKYLQNPERTTVTHFFAPAFSNPVVEVIRWEKSSGEAVDYLRWLFCATGKIPMVTKDEVCFMLDRIFDNWANEAAYLVDKATAAEIDSIALDYVHAGPFDVLNFANGNEIIPEVNTHQADVEGEHYRPAPIFASVDKWKTVPRGKPVAVSEDRSGAIRDRLLGILFSQSVDIIDRAIGQTEDLELGCRLAFAFKKGPLELMRDLGDEEVVRILGRLAKERPGMPMPEKSLNEYQNFSKHTLVDDLDGVLLITIRRPEALNALHEGITSEILAVLKAHEGNPSVKGFIITGYGNRAFSAGADIGNFPQYLGDAAGAERFARDSSAWLTYLDRMDKPVVAALNGMALGGGFELALRCHGIVAVRHAWMQLPEVTLGIVPGIGGMVVPYRRWPQGANIFHDMLRLGNKLTAEEANKIGVVAAVADDYPELIRAALKQVAALAEGGISGIADNPVVIPPPEPVAAVSFAGRNLSQATIEIIEKTVSGCAAAASLTEALEISYRAFGESACTAAAKEGIASFQEGRKPDFDKTG